MSKADRSRAFLYRDGPSQASRAMAALEPETAPVDEREPADWLAFLQRYAERLKYYNLQNLEEGDWSGLLGRVGDPEKLAEIAAFLANPEEFPGARYDACRRPHLALLLAFLRILQPVRAQINTFTRRHRDFYYRDVLGFRLRPAGSGRVHVLIQPEAGQGPFLLPAGTLLDAGRDPQGGELHYQTDANLVVTPAQVRECRSLFLHRTVVELDDVRRNPEGLIPFLPAAPEWQHQAEGPDKVFQALMEVALGDPNPGDPLPKYPFDPEAAGGGSIPAEANLFRDLDKLLAFIRDEKGVALSLPAFRHLMELRRSVLLSDPETARQWDRINKALQNAGARKRSNSSYTLVTARADDFITNLKAALEFNDTEYRSLYNELPDVNDIYGLVRHLDDQAVKDFVKSRLFFERTEDFTGMMDEVDDVYQRWQHLLDILRAAGRRKQRKDPRHVVDPPNLRSDDPKADLWERLLLHTIGDFSAELPTVAGKTLRNLDEVDAEVRRLERSFRMSAQDFAKARAVNADPKALSSQWQEVYPILTRARLEKERAKRRAVLHKARQGTPDVSAEINRMVIAAWREVDPQDANKGADHFKKLLLEPSEITALEAFARLSADKVDWERVAGILENAQERKEKWAPPALEFESWDNLYAAADATVLRPGVASAGADASGQHWRTFGEGPRGDGAVAPARLGFMIASPLLALSEGTRTITLTLEFTQAAALRESAIRAELAKANPPFRFLLSTADGPLEILPAKAEITWTSGTGLANSTSASPALNFVLRLPEQTPAIAPPAPDPLTPHTAPVLQVLLQDITDPDEPGAAPLKPYDPFRFLVLKKVRLEVVVTGLTALLLQNDESVLDPKTPFEPFGRMPLAGSRFLIAHPEICAKRLDQLEVAFDWLGLPEKGFSDWYQGFPAQTPPIQNNRSFTARVKLYDDRSFVDLKDVPLFRGDAAPAPSRFGITLDEIKAKYPGYDASPQVIIGENPLASDRYWILELNKPDFLHSIYPQEAARKAADKVILNPPYTPRARGLQINYSASVDLDPSENGTASPHQLFHAEPFGYRLIEAEKETESKDRKPRVPTWLPQYDDEGQLFIGLAQVAPPQSLSLLFQMAAGSADPNAVPEPVRWHYLSGNRWLDLDDGHLLSDTTQGLLNSGVIDLDLPISAAATVLPSELYWIRASIARNSRGVCDVVDIQAQAVSASLAPDSPGGSGLSLPPNGITGLVRPHPQVRGVRQPYSAFSGTLPEEEGHFAIRVSERLRHKGRALTCWDYERLVLEAFPEIHKVKCLAVDSTEDGPSFIRVIVIPDIRGKRPFDPFEPKVPADMIRRIEEFLAGRCAAGARFRVQNPRYCSLRLRFGVRLCAGRTPAAFYFAQLNEEVRRFLSPWAYDDSADIVFGSRISANLIVHFLEQRPYVDYVADLKLFLTLDDQPLTTTSEQVIDLAELTGGAPDLIVVSAPEHTIDPIPDHYVKTSFVGIDYMKMELDFSVA